MRLLRSKRVLVLLSAFTTAGMVAAIAFAAVTSQQVITDTTNMHLRVVKTIADGFATVMEQIRPAVPVLRLVTGSSVAETTMSGARAGRGPVELVLPEVPTVSRVHAIFTFAAGRWRVTNQGMNGLSVNGVPVSGEQPLSDGDSIRWGKSQDAPLSRIQIG